MENFPKEIKNNWLILGLIFSSIVWYATINSRLAKAEQDILDIKTAISEITNLKVQVATIGANVDFIKERVK